MKTAEFRSKVAEMDSSPESIPRLINALSISHDDLMRVDVSALETEPDYELEHALETSSC